MPPSVVTDCSAVLPKPRALLVLLPPEVMARPRPEANPPTVVTSWPAKLNLPSASVAVVAAVGDGHGHGAIAMPPSVVTPDRPR